MSLENFNNVPYIKEKLELKAQEAELSAEKAINSFPPALKWFFVVTIISLIPGYYIAKSVSKAIWDRKLKQYQITAKPSFTDAKPITIKKIDLAKISDGSFSAAATIVNENLELSADQVPYKFKFFNDKKELIQAVEDKFYILPNQQKYIVVPKISASETIASAELELPKDIPWIKRMQTPKVSLLATNPNSYNQFDPLSFAVEGNFLNTSPYQIKQVRLTFLVYGPDNKFIAANQRDEFTVIPNERRAYKQLWPNVFGPDAARIIVLAETDTLDRGNLTAPKGAPGPESDLGRPENQY